MSIVSGTIRRDSTDAVYMLETPAEGILHIAYQTVNRDDIGTRYHTLYAENERHLVNGINSLYGTSFNWGDMEGETLSFFNPADKILDPVIRLKFQRVGKYYLAEVVRSGDLSFDKAYPASEIGNIATHIDVSRGDVIYYATGDDVDILRRFLNTNYTTNKVSLSPSRGTDFTQLLLDFGYELSDLLVTVVVRNFNNDDGFTTLTFKSDVRIAADLNIDNFNKARVLKALSSVAGFTLTEDNMVGSDIVRAFDPIDGVDTTYLLHTVKKGDNTRYITTTANPLLPFPDSGQGSE